jgi:hypothetical protein
MAIGKIVSPSSWSLRTVADLSWFQDVQDTINATFGNYYFYFGDGSDGAVVADGVTSFVTTLGLNSPGYYYQLRDLFLTNLTINSGVTVNTNGFRVFVNGTLTLYGSIGCPGNNAPSAFTSGGAAGAATNAGGTLGFGSVGGAGGHDVGSGATGQGGALATSSLGGSGGGSGGSSGAGGNGGAPGSSGGIAGTGSPAAASGGNSTTFTASQGGYRMLWPLQTGRLANSTGAFVKGGAGGAGAPAQSGSGTYGGGGGGGGGFSLIWARQINIATSGVITCAGGSGAQGSAAGGSGGGGGGGGAIFLVGSSIGPESVSAAFTVIGGAGGPANGPATSAGGTGGSGTSLFVNLG